MTQRILIVDDSQIGLKLAGDALQKEGYQVFTARSGPEALLQVEKILPELVILDVVMPEMDGYEVLRRLRAKKSTAQLPVMMLTAQDTLEEKIQGFEAGADDYLTKPFQTAELQARVRVLLRRSGPALLAPPADSQARSKGKGIAIFSLKGGVGVSSLAVNLATGLTSIWGSPCVLVDLALVSGQAAFLLNIAPRKNWGDLISIQAEDIEAEILEKVMLRHTDGTLLLAAPQRPEQVELLSATKVNHVLNLLLASYAYAVLDLPHDFSDTTLAGMDVADEILVLMAPELSSVMAMRTTLNIFDTLGFSETKKIRVVLNQTFNKNCLARKSIEQALKRPVDLVLPYAGESFVNGLNRGQPPVLAEPTQPLGVFLEDIAFYFSRPEDRGKIPDQPTPAWERTYKRYVQRLNKGAA